MIFTGNCEVLYYQARHMHYENKSKEKTKKKGWLSGILGKF